MVSEIFCVISFCVGGILGYSLANDKDYVTIEWPVWVWLAVGAIVLWRIL